MQQQQDYKNLINLLDTGLIVVNTQYQVLLWNPCIARTTRISEATALGAFLPAIFDEPIDAALIDALKQACEMKLSRRLSHQLHPALLPLYQANNQQPLHHSILVQPITYQQQAACLLQVSDVTNTVRREQHLRAAMKQVQYLAEHDTLTNLASRTLLTRHLEEACATAAKNQQPFSLLFIDLDGFKSINDHFGHDAGDSLLKALAQRLQAALVDLQAGASVAARLGGDEMVVLLPLTQAKQALTLAENLCQVLAEPFTWKDQLLQVGASIGVAVWPKQGTTPKELMTHADKAMYLAKSLGKGQAALSPNS